MVMRNRPYKAGAAWGFIDRNQTGMEIMFVHAPNDHRLLVQQLGIAISAEESKRFFLCLRDGGTVVDCQSPFFDQPLFRLGKRTGASMDGMYFGHLYLPQRQLARPGSSPVQLDRKSVVLGKSRAVRVDLGCSRTIN